MSDELTLTGEEARFHPEKNDPSSIPAETQSRDVLQENVFRFLDEAYYGNGGFRDGNFLIPHSREMWYTTRKQFSYYVNFVKPVIRAMVEPIFAKEALRETNSALVETFLENVDNRGTAMQAFAQMVVNICRRHSIAFVVVDNMEDQPEALTEAIATRTMPYCYLRKANQMQEYTLDKFGNLIDILFLEKPAVYDGMTLKSKTQYRRWTPTETRLEENKNENAGVMVKTPEYVIVPGSVRVHNLNRVPVVVIRDTEIEQASDFLPEPKMYDIARVNHAIYNKDSEIREIERNQAFSVFCVNQNKASNLTIGTNNVLFYPLGANPPQFVAPPMDVLSQLIANRKDLREDLFRLAEQNGVVAVQEAKSGLALAYEFFAHESVLKQTAGIAEELEEKIVDLFGAWTVPAEYSVEYAKEFVPHGEEAKIKVYDTVLMQGPPNVLKNKIFAEEMRALFPDSEQSEFDALDAEMNEESTMDEGADTLDEENTPDAA